jgi:lipopolysaccharide export system permease protein
VKILDRYVLKEHLGPLAFALTALTSLLLLNYVAKQFGNLVGKGLAWTVIAEFFMLSIPFTIAMTLPMAVLVAVLYAFSRLASENEITALKASGVGMVRMLIPVLGGAALLSAAMIAFNDQVLPRANHRLRVLQGDIARKKPTFALREQVINEVSPGKLFLRAGHIDEGSNVMREVTIYDLSDPARRRTIYADSGDLALSPGERDLILTLYHGQMQEVPKSNPSQLQRLFYNVDYIRVRGVGNTFARDTSDTYKSDREMSICEMQSTVNSSERDLRAAEGDLRQALVAAVRTATTGARLPSSQPTAPSDSPSAHLGRAYCGLLALVGAGPARPDSGTRPAIDDALAARPTASSESSPGSSPANPARAAARPGSATPRPAGGTARRADSAARVVPPAAGAQQKPLRAKVLPPARAVRPRRDSAASVAAAASRAQASTPEEAAAAERELAAMAATETVTVDISPPPAPAEYRAPSGALYSSADAAVALAQVRSAIDGARARAEDSERNMNAYDVEIQKKFALSVACMVFVLLGAPIALRFPRGGVGLTIGVSLGVFALYYIGLIAGESLADRGFLPPFAAMWAANILFTLVGLLLLTRMGKEGSTARGGDMSELFDNVRGWIARQGRRLGIPLDRRRHAPAEQGAD